MDIVIKDIRKQDYKKAIQFAIKGMHFDWYLDSKFLLNAYGRYFWYLEMNRATQVFAAYVGDEFVGVLLAEIKDEPKKHHSVLEKTYVKLVDTIQRLLFSGGVEIYDETTKQLLTEYLETTKADGEIVFLAADPDCGVKGVGTALLNSLEAVEGGKTIYLHTDNACTYQFYEHRGFERVKEKEITLEMPKGSVPLKCFLYSKTI